MIPVGEEDDDDNLVEHHKQYTNNRLSDRVGFRYVRCSAYTTIAQVKKLLALKLYDSIDKMGLVSCYRIIIIINFFYLSTKIKIDILYNEELLGKDHTLRFVIATRFKSKVKLRLF